MVSASGRISRIRASWSSIGGMSDVPVMLPPGASRESTRPAPTGSVTPAKKMGLSVTACAIACAVGVAIATTRSFSAKFVAMSARVDWSPWAFADS